jgi:hypothetical protein
MIIDNLYRRSRNDLDSNLNRQPRRKPSTCSPVAILCPSLTRPIDPWPIVLPSCQFPSVRLDCDFVLPTSPFGDLGDIRKGDKGSTVPARGGVAGWVWGSRASDASGGKVMEGTLEECRMATVWLIEDGRGSFPGKLVAIGWP